MRKTKLLCILLTVVMLFTFIPAATLTAYAADSYEVKFDDNRGNIILTLTVPEGWDIWDALDELPDEEGEDIVFPREALMENGHAYRICDWYSDPECENWFSFYSDITEDITLYAEWVQCLDKLNVTLTVPKCGEATETQGYSEGYWSWFEQTNRPRFTYPDDVAYGPTLTDEDTGEYAGWWVMSEEDYDTPFIGTLEGGKEYYAEFYLYMKSGYYVYDGTEIIINGGSVPVVKRYSEYDMYDADIVAKVKIEHDWGEWTVVKEPTKTETGLKERVCKACGEKETEVIPALGGDTPEASKPASPPTGDESYITVCLASLAFASALMAAAFVMRSRKAK